MKKLNLNLYTYYFFRYSRSGEQVTIRSDVALESESILNSRREWTSEETLETRSGSLGGLFLKSSIFQSTWTLQVVNVETLRTLQFHVCESHDDWVELAFRQKHQRQNVYFTLSNLKSNYIVLCFISERVSKIDQQHFRSIVSQTLAFRTTAHVVLETTELSIG
jgi:hypothetical protein